MCVIHAMGQDFDTEAFVASSDLVPYRIRKKGDQTRRGRTIDASQVSFEFSGSPTPSLEIQIEEAVSFLRKHKSDVKALVDFPGVERVWIDFMNESRLSDEIVAQFDYLPPTLLKLVGELGLGIEISTYPIET